MGKGGANAFDPSILEIKVCLFLPAIRDQGPTGDQ